MSEDKTPKWLRDTQIRSWEPEILLSGIVLFGLFRIPGLLDDLLWYIKNNVSTTNDWDNFISVMKVAIYWLITGLFLHLITRGLWIGLVGLSYVFPNGVKKDKLNFKYGFKNTILRIPFPVDSIEKLERLCSSLFSIAFMLFMSIVGAYLYIFVVLFIPVILLVQIGGYTWADDLPIFEAYVIVIASLSLVYLIDFLTSGLLKRIPYFSKVYYPIHKVISALTLAPIYRPIYYSLVSNFNRWWISIFYVFFFVSTIYMSQRLQDGSGQRDPWSYIDMYSAHTKYNAFSGYYEDRNEEYVSFKAQIPSDVIDSNVLRLFITLNVDNQPKIKKYYNYDSLSTTIRNRDSLKLACVKDYFRILIGDSLVTDYSARFQHNQKSDQRGVVNYIDISSLEDDLYTVHITEPDSTVISRISFYKSTN